KVLVVERRWTPGADDRHVVQVQHPFGGQQRNAEERVLGHRQEEVHQPYRVRNVPWLRIRTDCWPPEEQRRDQEAGVLEVVDDVVLEGDVVQRAEVPAPVDRGEKEPGDDRESQPPGGMAVQDGKQYASRGRV